MINRFGLQDKDAFAEDFLKKLKTPLKESQERPSDSRLPRSVTADLRNVQICEAQALWTKSSLSRRHKP
ncbi:hypothetical protein WJX82_001447 [Trebouxia sp. C0006]